MLATVLEEMPPFPERESSILAKLKKKKPAAVKVIESPTNGHGDDKAKSLPVAKMSNDPPMPASAPQQSSQDLLVDIFATPNTAAPAAPAAAEPAYGLTNSKISITINFIEF